MMPGLLDLSASVGLLCSGCFAWLSVAANSKHVINLRIELGFLLCYLDKLGFTEVNLGGSGRTRGQAAPFGERT